MARSIFRTPTRHTPVRVYGRLTIEQNEARLLNECRISQSASAERATAFINAGPNWWLDARQAWLDEQIAADTARGGSAFGAMR